MLSALLVAAMRTTAPKWATRPSTSNHERRAMRRIILMAPQRIDSQRKRSALESNALAQLVSDGDLVDLHDIGEPESWSHWWQDMLATANEVTLILIPDGSMLGFRQDQRAERAAKVGVP